MNNQNFSLEENQQIFSACEIIRVSFIGSIIAKRLNEPEADSSLYEINAGQGSTIMTLIHRHKWSELFAQKDWLTMLSAIKNKHSRPSDVQEKKLGILEQFFPNEIKKLYLMNEEIFTACQGVIHFAYDVSFKQTKQYENPFAEERMRHCSLQSTVCELMWSFNWEDLFANTDWQEILKFAKTFNSLNKGNLEGYFKILENYFPEKVNEILA